MNVNPAYRTHELAYALNQSGVRLLLVGDGVQDQRLPRDGRAGGAASCPALERTVYLDTDDWAALVAEGEALPDGALAERMADAVAGRPDQHPVHLRHHRLPQGRDAEPPQHPQQRLLHHRADQLHRTRTGSASRCPSTTASGW